MIRIHIDGFNMIEFKSFLTEAESAAHMQAGKLHLQYYRFGRYGLNGTVTHITVGGRLVPVKPHEQIPHDKGEPVLLHYEHIEDQIFNTGSKGAVAAIDTLHGLIHNHDRIETQTKIDGSPSCFFGKDPKGRFFVATKSISNKEPKINYTPQDIERNHGNAPGLVEKLKAALKYLPKVYGNNRGTMQGDVMFTPQDIEPKMIDGKIHYTFRPNVVRNAVPADSEAGRQIEKAKFGFAVHTQYNGRGERLPAQHTDLEQHPDVFQMPVTSPSLDSDPMLQAKLKDLGRMVATTDQETFKYVSQPKVSALIKQYMNAKVRTRSLNEISAGDFINWVSVYHQKGIDEVKTPKGKQSRTEARDALVVDMVKNKEHIAQSFELHKKITDLKHDIVEALDAKQPVQRFFDNADGTMRRTNPEGYVAIGHTGTHKLIKREEFSHANFTQVKNWNAGKKNDDQQTMEGPKGQAKNAVLTFGRMSPPHIEHGHLIDAVTKKAKELGGDPFVYVSHTQDNKSNPLSALEKIAILKKAYPDNKNIFQHSTKDSPSIFSALANLHAQGYTSVTVVLGDDRTKEMMDSLKKYNGVFKDGKGYDFKTINVVSRHEINDTRDSKGLDGVHASDVRKAAIAGNFAKVRASMSPNLTDAMVRSIMAKIKSRVKT